MEPSAHSPKSETLPLPFMSTCDDSIHPHHDSQASSTGVYSNVPEYSPFHHLSSPSKRRRPTINTMSPRARSGRNRCATPGMPTPSCTPANSPEKLYFQLEDSEDPTIGASRPFSCSSKSLSPARHTPRRCSATRSVLGKLRRTPDSPPTPYASKETSGTTAAGPVVDLGPYPKKSTFTPSKLNFELAQAERRSSAYSAATAIYSGALRPDGAHAGLEAVHAPVRPGGAGGLFMGPSGLKRYKAMNEARIRNWEKVYGDLGPEREGGGVMTGEQCAGTNTTYRPIKTAEEEEGEELEDEWETDSDMTPGEQQVVGYVVPVKFD